MYRIGQEGSTGNKAFGSPGLSPGIVKKELVHGCGGNDDGAGPSSGSISIVDLGAFAAKTHIHLHRWEHNAILKLHATNGYRFKNFHWQHPRSIF
jgi:hypothetical protein